MRARAPPFPHHARPDRAGGSPRRSARRRSAAPRGRARHPHGRSLSGLRPASVSPRRRTVPARVGTTPMIACSVVDLPAPFGPIRPTISPRPTERRDAANRSDGAVTHRQPVRARAAAQPATSPVLLAHRALTQVRGGDVEIAADLGGRPLGERAALVEHLDPVADLHHERHVVVDQEDAHLVLVAHDSHDRGELGHLGFRQARRRLVHEHEARLASPARVPRRACARLRGPAGRPAVRVARPSRAARRAPRPRRAPRVGRRRRRAPRPRRSRAPSEARNERLCWNVRASPARPRRCALQRVMSRLFELDRPGARHVEAREHVHECRLAGAVRPDQADHLVAVQLQRRRPRARGRLRTTARGRPPGAILRAAVSRVSSLRIRSSGPSSRRSGRRIWERCSGSGSRGTGGRRRCGRFRERHAARTPSAPS